MPAISPGILGATWGLIAGDAQPAAIRSMHENPKVNRAAGWGLEFILFIDV
jgi:hypothetical protein